MPAEVMPSTSAHGTTQGAEITPEFIVDMSRPPGVYPGVIRIRAQNTYATRSDIQRWLRQCLRELEDELQRAEVDAGVY